MQVTSMDFARPRGIADEIHHDRLVGRRSGTQQLVGHFRGWRFGNKYNDFRFAIPVQDVQPLAGSHSTHRLCEVTSAGAKGVSDATPQLVDASAHLLQPRARCGDDSDWPPAHPVGKAQPHPVDDGRATVGTHDQQALVSRRPLEAGLVGQRDIVAVEEHVLVQAQCLAGDISGIAPGNGDEHPRRSG
jgi:hypothetical protein